MKRTRKEQAEDIAQEIAEKKKSKPKSQSMDANPDAWSKNPLARIEKMLETLSIKFTSTSDDLYERLAKLEDKEDSSDRKIPTRSKCRDYIVCLGDPVLMNFEEDEDDEDGDEEIFRFGNSIITVIECEHPDSPSDYGNQRDLIRMRVHAKGPKEAVQAFAIRLCRDFKKAKDGISICVSRVVGGDKS